MLKKKLPASKKGQESKRINFVSKTAKALLIVVLFAAVFLIAPYVLAQGLTVPNLEGSGLASPSLGVIVARIINAALGLLGLVAVIIILYGGYLWMTARGEAERVQKAKKLLIQALVGLIIIIMAFAIAQFVFWALGINPWGGGEGGGGGGGVGGGGGGGSALGAGILRSHYPARNARNIPRNTKIAITFKEPVCGLSNDRNNNRIWGDCVDLNGNGIIGEIDDKDKDGVFDAGELSECDLVAIDKVKIRKKADVSGPVLQWVKALSTDNKTFVLIPIDPLGNDQTPTEYTVELTKVINYTPKCDTYFSGYNWNFEVSTELDLTPPQIESVVPKAVASPLTTARNIVIQINYNEAIDPLTLGGKLVIAGGAKTGALDTASPDFYDLMTVKAGADYVAGEFYFSNQYRTVEFITADPCGKNSCGKDIFCLPSSSEISVLIKAATLAQAGKPTAQEGSSSTIYDGIVDMCSNSLDGNKDGAAQGPAVTYDMNLAEEPAETNGDNATWRFNTNNLIDLIPPEVKTRNPDATDNAVLISADMNLSFDKILLSNSILSGVSLILDQSDLNANEEESGYWIEKREITEGETTIIIKTSGLWNDRTYGIVAKSGILDNMQNCFMPCSDKDYCLRAETDTLGQYEEGTTWEGDYENCNVAP